MKRIIFGIMLILILIGVLTLISNIRSVESDSEVLFFDDFSVDSGMWEYLGSAYRDPTNQFLVLTEPVSNQRGVAFFNTTFRTCFTANFSFKAGGGSGADGFVLFFYKQRYSFFHYGGTLAFNDIYPNGTYKIIPGYGIEFDNWRNIERPGLIEHADPSSNHIALIKDHVGNHLLYVNDPRTEDNIWHNVSVIVKESTIRVLVDEALVFQWNGTIDRTFDSFGFCGATGAATNWHIIDNFSLKIQTPISPTIDATVEIEPKSLNLKSKGRCITTHTELSDNYDVKDVNVSTMTLNNTIPAKLKPITIGDYDNDGIPDLMVKFDRAEVISYILDNVNLTKLYEERFMTIILTITGKLNDGTPFQGSDTIRIMMPMPRGPGRHIFPI